MSDGLAARSVRLKPERAVLAPGLEISRMVTGLWQVADMERDGAPLDPVRASAAIRALGCAGLSRHL